jgi:hypothetical protein
MAGASCDTVLAALEMEVDVIDESEASPGSRLGRVTLKTTLLFVSVAEAACLNRFGDKYPRCGDGWRNRVPDDPYRRSVLLDRGKGVS